MQRIIEDIRESEIEDALIANLEVFRELLNLEKDVRLITRQLRLIDGKKRLDILLAVGDQIFLVELKAEPFHRDNIKQIMTYKEELKKLQIEKNLIAGEIIPVILATDYTEIDLNICIANGLKVVKYSPIDILTKYYNKVASVARFMQVRPVDLDVFNIGLINRVIKALGDGVLAPKDISKVTKLSLLSVNHHLKFSVALALVTQRKNRYYLTDMGLKYISLGDELLTRDELSTEQAELIREYVARDPFASPVIFGIYCIVESVFFLARNSYPVDFEELKSFFLKASGKQYEWQAPKSLATATYTYLNYATKLGLLGKVGRHVIITPSGFRFILMLQLYKSIEMVESLAPVPNR